MPKLILNLNPMLADRQPGSMLSKSMDCGVTYPTYRRMALGKWHPQTIDTLERFLSAQGFTAEELSNTRLGDIFIVKEAE